jgi:hypothetical protein
MRFFNKTILWLVIVPAMILLTTIGATVGDEVEDQVGVIRSSVDIGAYQSTMLSTSPDQADENNSGINEVFVTEPDPYKGWGNWCEPIDYEKSCKTSEDCEGIRHVARRPLRCVHPWNSNNEDYKVCAPGFSGRVERRWRYARLRELVGQQYFDEPEHCSDWSWNLTTTKKGNPYKYERAFVDGRPVHRQFWKCGPEYRKAEELTKFLWLIYKRETSARPWKRHRLNPDRAANERAWVKHAKRYGWIVETECINPRQKKCRSKDRVITNSYPDPNAEEHNPHYDNRFRFQFGLGGLGQNTALWLATWDKMAPPEVLCLEPVQFETYLRNARSIVKKLENGIDCDGDLKKDYWDKEPTFVVVHRGASGGKLCPAKTLAKQRRQAEYEKLFVARANKLGLDIESPVTVEMLGNPIPKETQNERMRELLSILDEKLPAPF